MIPIAILVGLSLMAASAYVVISKRSRCPLCKRARVPRAQACPFCGSPYVDIAESLTAWRERTSSSQRPQLRCIEGPTRGQVFPISGSHFSIGRSTDNHLRVPGLLVSRHHALVVHQDDRFVLYDRDSTNGTYVNGQRVANHLLQPGDRIQIGSLVFAFSLPYDRVSPPVQPVPEPPARDIPIDQHMSLAEYELLEPIAKGGTAWVYKAIAPDQRQTVVVKILHQTDPYLQAKFEDEGRIGRLLRHPHIASIHDYGHNGRYYIVMEYVEGGSLRDRLTHESLVPVGQIVSIVGQACAALDYAHSQGVIHRDIKPENIMFTAEGKVKLVDFGIARLTSSVRRTSNGMIVGTPYYLSYEQAKGLEVDHRSDIYSLGVVLYEMVTGQPPFRGDSLEVVHKHLTEEPRSPREMNPDIPLNIEAVILRALRKNPRQRFQTAREMAHALGYRGAFVSEPQPLERTRQPSRQPSGDPSAREVTIPAARLVVMTGRMRGSTIELSDSVTSIRRRHVDPGDLLISREHARTLRMGQQVWLEDLGSRNGTYHNGLRIFDRVVLQRGDEIRIGNSILRYEN